MNLSHSNIPTVAENGDCRRIRRQIVAVFDDYSLQCMWTGLKDVFGGKCLVSTIPLPFCRCRFAVAVTQEFHKRRKNYVAYVKKIRCAVDVPTCRCAVTVVP